MCQRDSPDQIAGKVLWHYYKHRQRTFTTAWLISAMSRVMAREETPSAGSQGQAHAGGTGERLCVGGNRSRCPERRHTSNECCLACALLSMGQDSLGCCKKRFMRQDSRACSRNLHGGKDRSVVLFPAVHGSDDPQDRAAGTAGDPHMEERTVALDCFLLFMILD